MSGAEPCRQPFRCIFRNIVVVESKLSIVGGVRLDLADNLLSPFLECSMKGY